VKAVLNMI